MKINKIWNYLKFIIRNKDGIAIYMSILGLMNYKVISYYKKRFWIPQYGEFDKVKNWEKHHIMIPEEVYESKSMSGIIMKWAKQSKTNNVLFAGDGNIIKPYLKPYFSKITTASMSNNSDFYWNFEKELPKDIGTFDLIINQSCFEHIINPYKHIEDMVKLLNKGGRIIIQTHTQFSCYHRYPVDTLRYNPDWFEEVAKRLNLKVIKRAVLKTTIIYMFEKGVVK